MNETSGVDFIEDVVKAPEDRHAIDRRGELAIRDAADANLVAAYRAHATWQEPCECEEVDGVLVVVGRDPVPGPFRNIAVRLDRAVRPAEVLRVARAIFGPRKRGFSIVARSLHDADLEAHVRAIGGSAWLEEPCMVVTEPVAVRPVHRALRFERVRDVTQVRDAVGVAASAFVSLGVPVREVHATLARHERLLDASVAGIVAYDGDLPVATALTLFSGEAAGVYWVGTAPGARGRGLGAACTALATNAGFLRGASVVTLQASPFGMPVYTRMGFRVVDRLQLFQMP